MRNSLCPRDQTTIVFDPKPKGTAGYEAQNFSETGRRLHSGCWGRSGGELYLNLTKDQLEAAKSSLGQVLVERYGDTLGKTLDQEVQEELKTTLGQLPNIGATQENVWAGNMPPTALGLATYRVLVPKYATLEEVGRILYDIMQRETGGITGFIMRAMYNEGAMMQKLKSLAARSQQRQYPEDWVMTFVEGAGQDFTYGVDVTECAIQKYLTKQGAPELTRYLCLTDYVSSEAMGRGLVRCKTLAEECASCDFRYKRGRPSYLYPLRDGWPPKFLASCPT